MNLLSHNSVTSIVHFAGYIVNRRNRQNGATQQKLQEENNEYIFRQLQKEESFCNRKYSADTQNTATARGTIS